MKGTKTITRKDIITGKLKSLTAEEAYEEIISTPEGQNLVDEWAVETVDIFEDILQGAGTLEINDFIYSYNVLLIIKRVPGMLLNKAVNNMIQGYKMEKGDFDLWILYLKTHPAKPTYVGFRDFKNEEGVLKMR